MVSPPVITGKRYSTPDCCCPKEFSVTQLILIPVKTMAEQLSLLESELFCKIEPRDFLRHVWVHQRLRETPISASIQHFNHISEWIASMIVSQLEIEKRAIVYEYCLRIAVELEQLNNFNSLMAVLAGVNSAAILRLKKTRQRVADFNQGLVDTVSRLEKLMSSERSFYNYRYVLKQKVNTPGIPYLGIHQQDLVSLCEANKDHKTNGKIHWQKFRLMGESIMEVIQFQKRTHDWIKPQPFIRYFIKNERVLTEDERYERSIKVEPRLSLNKPKTLHPSSSTSRWLMLKDMML
ncbi:hypothetical protein G6F56_010801 [Rhizopus delemar]|nr:hypothetical protein G6F56_010801 [Rhizopus delemar]